MDDAYHDTVPAHTAVADPPCEHGGRAKLSKTGEKHRRVVRQSRALIETRAGEPIRVTELSRAACVSVKTLERAFSSVLGITPQQYIRRVRLANAREMLVAGSRCRLRVSDVVESCGFGHHGRFAEAYLAVYGEKPSVTLERARPRAIGEPAMASDGGSLSPASPARKGSTGAPRNHRTAGVSANARFRASAPYLPQELFNGK